MKKIVSQAIAGLVLFFLSLVSITAAERRSLHTGTPEVTAGLQRLSRLPSSNRLQMAIGLPLRDRNTLTNLLQQLYTPGSPNYHHFLTSEEFAEKFGPIEQDYQKVVDFANTNGLEVVGRYGNRAVLDVAGKVSDIERTFQVTLGTYQHPTEDRQFYSPDVEPSVDTDLPISFISGMDNYFIARPSSLHTRSLADASHPMSGSAPNGFYLGSDYRNAYLPGTSLTGAGQTIGLFEGDNGYTPSDIKNYESIAGLPDVTLQNVLKDGVSNVPGSEILEVSLDIELVIAMAPGMDQVNIYEGTSDVDIMNEMASPTQGEPRPNQISCSYGISGETNLEPALIQMAMQGQSFFYASGDSGAFQPNGISTNTQQDFEYITAVGGTELVMNGNGQSYASETVWNNGPGDRSSGGILTMVPIPDYQQGIDMSVNGGSTSKRNLPDVAMDADDFYVILTVVYTNGNPPLPGQPGGAQGTSGAAPLWAGFTALANQQAASEGKPSLGFLNPALYDIAKGSQYTSAFHDIITGNNTNSGSPTLYFAKPGYDLCTGFGSPTGAILLNALVGFSGPTYVDFNYTGSVQNGTYDDPFKTLAGGVAAVASGGTIFIKTAGSSSETMTISKPMTITAIDGTATIGQP